MSLISWVLFSSQKVNSTLKKLVYTTYRTRVCKKSSIASLRLVGSLRPSQIDKVITTMVIRPLDEPTTCAPQSAVANV